MKDPKTDLGNMPHERRLYALQSLPRHLSMAEQKEVLFHLLTDFDFIEAKINTLAYRSLVDDYGLALNPPVYMSSVETRILKLIQSAIRLSANALEDSISHLAGQLIGRLKSYKACRIRSLLAQAESRQRHPCLLPIKASLIQPSGPLMRSFQGHSSYVLSLAVLPDYRTIVSGGMDHTIRTWDLQSGKSVHTMKAGHAISSVAAIPDSRFVISGSWDGMLMMWDLQKGEAVRSLKAHREGVNALAVTANGQLVVSGAGGLEKKLTPTLKVWNVELWKKVHAFGDYKRKVWALSLTPDGRRLVSGGWDLKVWDLYTGKEIYTLEIGHHVVNVLAVSPDGHLLASGTLNSPVICIWDLNTSHEVCTIETKHGGHPGAICFTPDCRFIVVGWEDGTLRIWDLKTGKQTCTFHGHTGQVNAVALAANDHLIISGANDTELKVWNLQRKGKSNGFKIHPCPIEVLAVTPDGCLMVSGGGGRLWHRDGVVDVCYLSSAKHLHTLWRGLPTVSALALIPSGRFAVSASVDNVLKVWDLNKGEATRILKLSEWKDDQEWVVSLAVTPDGRSAVCGFRLGDLNFRSLRNGREIWRAHVAPNGVTAVVVAPDGHVVISGSGDLGTKKDYSIKVWDLRSSKRLRVLEGHAGCVRALAMSSDSRLLVSGSDDSTLRFWNLRSFKEIRRIKAHKGGVNALAISSDDSFIVSASSDKSLKAWKVSRGECLGTFRGEDALLTCAILPDNRTVVAGEYSGRIHLLRLVRPGFS